MSSTHRAFLEPLFEVELTNAMVEMSTQASMLARCLREFADRRGVEHVQVELVAEKKISANLQAEVEALHLVQEEFEKKQVELQLLSG